MIGIVVSLMITTVFSASVYASEPGTETTALGIQLGDGKDPSILLAPDGNWYVVYIKYNPTMNIYDKIAFKKYTPTGELLIAEKIISSTSHNLDKEELEVATDASGNLLIVFNCYSDNGIFPGTGYPWDDWDLRFISVNPQGDILVPERLLHDSMYYAHAICIVYDGSFFYAAWSEWTSRAGYSNTGWRTSEQWFGAFELNGDAKWIKNVKNEWPSASVSRIGEIDVQGNDLYLSWTDSNLNYWGDLYIAKFSTANGALIAGPVRLESHSALVSPADVYIDNNGDIQITSHVSWGKPAWLIFMKVKSDLTVLVPWKDLTINQFSDSGSSYGSYNSHILDKGNGYSYVVYFQRWTDVDMDIMYMEIDYNGNYGANPYKYLLDTPGMSLLTGTFLQPAINIIVYSYNDYVPGAPGSDYKAGFYYIEGPTAVLVAIPDRTAVLQTVTFDGTGSQPPTGGSIISYSWNFDDGVTYTETPTNAPDGAFNGITTHAYNNGGTYTVTLTVTDNNDFTDSDTCTVMVGPDLTLEAGDITYSAGTVSAIIHNIGAQNAVPSFGNIVAEFRQNGVPFAEALTTIVPAYGSWVASVAWTPAIGTYDITVIVDPYIAPGRVVEADETNNEATVTLLIGPDLTFVNPDVDIVFTTINPTFYVITATVHNIGTEPANNVVVEFYDGVTLIPSPFTISSIPANGGTGTAGIFLLGPSIGIHTINVKIDPSNTILEANELNNEGSKLLRVGPDLVVDSTDITITMPNPIPIGSTTPITATIRNIGTWNAQNVVVQFYDGDPVAGGVKIDGDQIIASIPAGGFGLATVQWTSVAGLHDIFVLIDPLNAIQEADEGNNKDFKPVVVGIQTAINLASNYDTITLQATTYVETITINKPIKLRGAGAGTTIIDGDLTLGNVIHVTADDVVIEEFTVQNGDNGYGIYCDYIDNVKISYIEITHCIYGLYMDHTTNSRIQHNDLSYNAYGFYAYTSYDGGIWYNTIHHNTVGAKLDNSVIWHCANWNIFHDNGIALSYDPPSPIPTTVFDNNKFYSNIIAIECVDASNLSLTNNIISNNSVGIFCKSGSPTIANNRLYYNSIGIYIAPSSSPTLSNNAFFGNTVDTTAIEPSLAPFAVATPRHQTIQTSEYASFDASLSRDVNNDVVEYSWDFGDGFTGQGAQITHQYMENGEYVVTLTVRDAHNNVATDTATVNVLNKPPIAAIEVYQLVDVMLTVEGRKDNTVTMCVLENGAIIDSVSVTRNSGNPNEQAKTLTLKRYLGRSYQILLEYSAQHEGANPVKITIAGETDSTTIHHTFNTKDGFEQTITFGIDDELNDVLEGTTTYFFDATQSYDLDGTLQYYHWEFSDGTTADTPVVEKIVTQTPFTAILTVTDNDEAIATATITI